MRHVGGHKEKCDNKSNLLPVIVAEIYDISKNYRPSD